MACYPCTWQVPMLSLLAHILLLASSSVSIYHVNDDLSVLLSFKYYIKNDPGQALSSWDATDNGTNNLSTDFCRWNGIACNDHRHPGRVTAIRLRGSDLGGTISPHIGTLPVDIGRLRSLQVLDLSHNRFEGQIPQSLGNITGLSKLCISNNYLNGTIPTSLGKLRALASMDISCNFLSGRIPQEILSIPALTILLKLSNNALSGSIPTQIGHLNNLIAIDLSMNKLTGEIPDDIGSCVQLQLLHLQGNILQGKLPKGLEKLGVLENLDLSRNNLIGPIPEFLERIKTLNHLNLSFNNLSGPVPDTGIFCNATILSLTGNSMLCGGPPFLQFPSCASVHSQHRMHLLIVFCIPGTLIFLLFSITTYCCIKRRVKPNIVYQENLFLSEAHERISYNQLRSATQSFSPANLIGSGSFGNVYIGTFIIDENLATVAIKVINLNLRGASRSFLTECNALRRIRHRNLVKVITVCSGLDHNGDEFKALVLEFICNGSLDEWLHPNTMENSMTAKRLSLMRRLCIALDVAVALEYLHHNIEPPIVHSDIKPSNILLDDDLVAHVTDFGLAKIMYAEVWNKNHGDNESSSLAVKGTIGYVPPGQLLLLFKLELFLVHFNGFFLL
uniref:Protein kinase domain-containing protein n=1 Tax=Setaria viridis TaxID=4556 RepID=A0A4U6V0J8_SETVI|nr:hypothetical protein SEVIR_4G145700v2 [Setaria viridis]